MFQNLDWLAFDSGAKIQVHRLEMEHCMYYEIKTKKRPLSLLNQIKPNLIEDLELDFISPTSLVLFFKALGSERYLHKGQKLIRTMT